MNYEQFKNEANHKNWTMLHSYEIEKNKPSLAIRFEIWVTPEAFEGMYCVEIWENEMVLVYKFIDEFNF